MSVCECWHETGGNDFGGNPIGRCSGTRELDYCYCRGDETDCDFYPDRRKAALEALKNPVENPPENPENVNHPSHYNQSNIECIDAIRASMSEEEFKGFCKGNVLKYLWRYEHKNGFEDLRKAEWYLGHLKEVCGNPRESDSV